MLGEPLKRNLYAIFAADVVGYSRIMGADEEEAFRLLRAHRAITDSVIELHGGRVFNAAGDSVLAAFESPVEAVRAAIEIQDAIRTRNLSLPEERRLTFRIGINLGDVIIKDGDLLGDAVNVAARLESQAAPGGLCISGTVYDQIVGKLDLQFRTAGELALKNIERPVRAYMFGGDAAAAPGAAQTSAPDRRKPSRPALVAAGATALAAIAAAVLLLPMPWLTGAAGARGHDGVWSGMWCPQAFRGLDEVCVSRVVTVADGRIEMQNGDPGEPGYTRLSGTVAPAGTIAMSGESVGGQGPGRGRTFPVDLRGQIEGDKMTMLGTVGPREVRFDLTRAPR